jgi:hypothetical protein
MGVSDASGSKSAEGPSVARARGEGGDDHRERVAVAAALADQLRRGGEAAGDRAVLDLDGLAQALGQRGLERAGDEVGAAAGREGEDQAHGARRPGGGPGEGRRRRGRRG